MSAYPHPQATSPPTMPSFYYGAFHPSPQPAREPQPAPPVLPPPKPQYPPTEVNTSGKYSEKRTPELADVSLRIKVEGYDKAAVLREFKVSANEVVGAVVSLAPPKVAVTAGSLVDSEWPIKNPDKAIVRWSTGQLSSRSWEEIQSSETTTTTSQGGFSIISTQVGTSVEKTEYTKIRKYSTSQTLSITFHDFDALEVFVTRVTAQKNVEFDSIGWRISDAKRKDLEASVIAGAVLDARALAHKLLAPLVDAPPRLKAVEINNGGGDSRRIAYMSSAPARDYNNSRDEDEPKINFEPEPIAHEHSVNVKWVVVE
ncbi:uncharacterized protein LOC62_07G008841 [Vanrija pseudolonga]|uniref:SIMPL domain-containing protein n=1 Tax=Vanrija pseudolonga TaxID=143232 RepID=A0AAF0YIN7_9TREE|nr:hypothetical protein LOC62_07G008841 [Vanrija pseudolonga]